MQKIPMTVNGSKQLEEELNNLISCERVNVIKAIAEARSHGDLSENAEYSAAKEKQSFIEGRIAEIQYKISNANIIDPSKINHNGKIVFGLNIKLSDMDTNNEVIYQIVGEDEADLIKGKISINSPVARALIGRSIGDVVEVKTPKGIKEYEVIDFYSCA